MDKFETACHRAAELRDKERVAGGIGTLGERTLHAVLKLYCEPDETKHEIKVGRHHADICNDGGIMEIQTRGFAKLRDKLTVLLEAQRVTVVYPIAATKWLLWVDPETGEITGKRKSPRRGCANDVFYELGWIKGLLSHPNLRFRLILLDIEEYRLLNGWSRDRKRGSVRQERIPVALQGDILVEGVAGYVRLIPKEVPVGFTTRDYAKAAGIPPKAAGRALNVLAHVGAITLVGKQGRMNLYERVVKEQEDETV